MDHLRFDFVYVQLALNMRYILNFMDVYLIMSVFWLNQVSINVIEIDLDSFVEFVFELDSNECNWAS